MARLVFVLVLAALLPLGFTASTLGGNHDETDVSWEFSGENQPTYLALWEVGDRTSVSRCSARQREFLYENYAILHPDFRPLMDEPGLRKQWRMSLILRGDDGADPLNDCFYDMLKNRWYDGTKSLERERVIFCGVIARGLDKPLLRAARAISELAFYGFNGSASALRFVLDADPGFLGVKLNDDVRYLSQLIIDDVVEPDGSLREMVKQFLTPSAGDLLTPERRAFVENAFGRRDYRSVLDTTEPCQVMN